MKSPSQESVGEKCPPNCQTTLNARRPSLMPVTHDESDGETLTFMKKPKRRIEGSIEVLKEQWLGVHCVYRNVVSATRCDAMASRVIRRSD